MVSINVKPIGAANSYTPYRGCLEFMKCQDHQVFLYGSTGSGKTTVGCYKMMLLCLKYPGIKFLFTRQSYRALIKSGVETFERVLAENGLETGNGHNKIRKLGGSKPEEFQFPWARRKDEKSNRIYEGRSRIVLASLDKVYDEMGAEYDYIYVNQPEQITQDDWMFLATRANGRRDASPYPQLYGDPNPQQTRHWIKTGGYQLINGEKVGDDTRWRLIKSTYKDNPTLWDQKLDKATKHGEELLGRLDQSLNSVMKKRLIEGEWADAEGLVYGDSWIRSKHLISTYNFYKKYPNGIENNWDRFWTMDFGYQDPFVFACWAKIPGTEQYVRYKLIYMTNRTVNEHAEKILSVTLGEPRPKLVLADRNPQEIAILSQALGVNIISAKKGAGSKKAGINVIIDMLNKEELLFLDDALVEEDPRLRAAKKPIGFEEEVESYMWDIDKKDSDNPKDGDDHESDSMLYLFSHIKADDKRVKFVWI